MNRKKGFNIIEVTISMMITLIAILMIITIYTNIISAQAKGIGKSVSSSVAERVLQKIITDHLHDIKLRLLDGKGSTLPSKFELIGKDVINGNVYYYYSKIYKSSNKSFKNTSIAKADVYVYWNLGDQKTEQEIKDLVAMENVKNCVKFSRLITFSDED